MILVTGSTGFFGHHIVESLKKRNLPVRGFTRDDADLLDRTKTIAAFKRIHPTTVIHAAAMAGGIGLNSRHPAEMLSVNTQMTLNVLEAGAEADILRFVGIGSSCAYPDLDRPLHERDFWLGSPNSTVYGYGMAKRFLWTAQQAYSRQYGFRVSHLIFPNLYGPHDDFESDRSHVVGALIARFWAAKETGLPSVVCWGTGNAQRELMYAEDAAEGVAISFAHSSFHYQATGLLNIGTGTAHTIQEIASTISNLIGYQGTIIWDATKPDGNALKVMDVSTLREAFPDFQTTPLAEGLRRTVEWYAKRKSLVNTLTT